MSQKLHREILIGGFCLIASLLLWILCYWQLEMVWIAPITPWGYDFAGFGDLGLPLYKWRDFWWIIQQFAYLSGLFGVYKMTKSYYQT